MKWFFGEVPAPGGPHKLWKATGRNILDAFISPSGDKDKPWSLLVNVGIPIFDIYRQHSITKHATVLEAMNHAEKILASYRAEFQRLVDICDEASGPHIVTSLGDKGVFHPFKED